MPRDKSDIREDVIGIVIILFLVGVATAIIYTHGNFGGVRI